MKIISIVNHKGGAGKTSSSINLAAGLSRKEKKVLLVDLDAQANTTTGLGMDDNNRILYDAIKHNAKFEPQKKNKYDVLAGSFATADLEEEMHSMMSKETRLKMLLNQYSSDYDYCIIDCPPALSTLTVNAMVASDYLLIPLNALYYSLTAIESIFSIHADVQKTGLNPDLKILGAFVTNYDGRRRIEQEINNVIKENYASILLNTIIRKDVKITESQTPPNCTDIFDYSLSSKGATDYHSLTLEVLKVVS